MRIGQLSSNLHGQAAVQLMPLHLFKLSLVAEIWYSPVLFIDGARSPLADIYNPVVKMAVHV